MVSSDVQCRRLLASSLTSCRVRENWDSSYSFVLAGKVREGGKIRNGQCKSSCSVIRLCSFFGLLTLNENFFDWVVYPVAQVPKGTVGYARIIYKV